MVTPTTLGHLVTRTRRGRRATVTFAIVALALGILIGLLESLLDLPQWVGYLCLALFAWTTVAVLFRMAEAEDQSPPQ